MLILTGIFGCGWAFNNYLMLTDAVSIGARDLAISAQQTLDPCATAANAIYNAAPYLTQTGMQFTFVLNGTSYGPYQKTTGSKGTSVSCSSSSNTTGAAGNLVQGADAQVIVTYPCVITVYGANIGCTLTAMATELVQ
jgi:Flp pilus assembly protein TadG